MSVWSDAEWEKQWRRHFNYAESIRFTVHFDEKNSVSGENMQTTLVVGNSRKVTGAPVNASGGPSTAVLSNQAFTSSDTAIFTTIADPAVPGGAIIISVAAGTATFTETATATEPDGTTTEKIQGVMTVIVTAAPPPPPPVAASIVFTVGDEFPSAPTPPPAPVPVP